MRKQPRPTALLSIVALVALVLPLLSTPALQARAPESDSVAPAAVINLTAVAGDSPGTVELSWIAPGDDGSTGTATKYIVRYNSAPITESNWASSTNASSEPAPGPAGNVEAMTVSGLDSGRSYHFALKTQDEVPNTSGVSNSPRAMAGRSANATNLPLVTRVAGVEPVIPDTTEVLPASTTQRLDSVSGDGTVFTFSTSTPELEALEPGDIMVGDACDAAPYGFLRKVTSVSSPGGQVVVVTKDVTIEEAVETGAVRVSHTLTPGDVAGGTLARGDSLSARPGIEGSLYFLYTLDEVVLYDDDGDPDTKNDRITANGSIRLEPRFDFSLDVRGFKLKELYFASGADETAELEIGAKVKYPLIDEEVEIVEHYFNPITVPIGFFRWCSSQS